MNNSNVIDFAIYQEQPKASLQKASCSDELITAIENLIQRLRESKPLKDVAG